MKPPKKPKKFNDQLPECIPLNAFSTNSLEVIQHFGIEAPHILNEYSIKIEDAYISLLDKLVKDRAEIKRLQELLTKNNISYDEPNESDPSSKSE